MTEPRRRIPPDFLAFLLGHVAGPHQQTRRPKFSAQFVASTPGLEVREALRAAFKNAAFDAARGHGHPRRPTTRGDARKGFDFHAAASPLRSDLAQHSTAP